MRLAAAIAASVGFCFAGGPAVAQAPPVEEALRQIARELSSTLPVRVDREKSLETIVALHSTLIFKYKFNDETTIRDPRFDPKLYEKHLARSLRASTCTDKGLAALLRRGARFNYLFVDKYGVKVVDFTLDAATCVSH